jgi:hypothetical protein
MVAGKLGCRLSIWINASSFRLPPTGDNQGRPCVSDAELVKLTNAVQRSGENTADEGVQLFGVTG